MADLGLTTPLTQAGLGNRELACGGLEVREMAFQTLLRLRALAGGSELNRLLADSGVRLPTEPNRIVAGAATTLWLRPTEWLLVGASQDGKNLRNTLSKALTTRPVAITDVSHSTATFRLSGPVAWALLSKHCGLDLDPEVFRRGHSAQTRLAGVGAVLYRHEEGIDVMVDRSVAGYLYKRFEDAIEHARLLAG